MPNTVSIQSKKQLAIQLIKRFGLTAARQTCIQNKWTDVLAYLDEVGKSH